MPKLKNILIKTKNIILKIGSYLIVLALLILISYASIITVSNELNKDEDKKQDDFICSVTGIELHGYLQTYIPKSDYGDNNRLLADEASAEQIIEYIHNAEQDSRTKAIIIDIDSGGGSTVAGIEISEALKRSPLATVAIIRDRGGSAAYWAATGAERIFATANSEVGSIGVIGSYLDSSKKNTKDGLTYNELTSGKFKSLGTANKPMSEDDRKLMMRDVNIMYENFIKAVAENRNLAIKDVRHIADGSTMLGDMAMEHGLIDQIGGFPEAEEYLKDKIGEEVQVCWN